jgi:2-methylcitrate dehydratase PrpD
VSLTAALADAAKGLRFDDLDEEVVARAEDLFLDWLACAIAGGGERPAQAMARLADEMGPPDGPAELFGRAAGTSPYFAALANGTASHSIEQDDVHNASVFHPGTVVFPAALAVAQDQGAHGRDFIVAVVAGYEIGVRVARYLGASHYRVFHTTGTAGTLAAAGAAGLLLGLDRKQLVHALGTAGTQAAGLWEFLADGADSKPLHAGRAAASGLLAAYAARSGVTGAAAILEGSRGMAAGMLGQGDDAVVHAPWGAPFALAETSMKHHAACRHIHPAADALLACIADNDLDANRVVSVTARVHQAALDVTWPAAWPVTPHQAKFSLPFVLALVATRRQARVDDFTTADLGDPAIRGFAERVHAELDEEVEAAYPERWLGLVEVGLDDGRTFTSRVDEPRGDPGNPLTRDDLVEKFHALARWSQRAREEDVDRLAELAWRLRDQQVLANLQATVV